MNSYDVGVISDRGLNPRRPVNEDRYLLLPECHIFAVADGVGGEQAGEVASQTLVDMLAEAMCNYQSPGELTTYLDVTLQRANQQIFQASQSREELSGMASTVAMVCLEEDRATIAHVGDSRIYSLRGNRLKQETHDHTDHEDARRAGKLTPQDIARYRAKNVINRAVGAEAEIEPEFNHISLNGVDALLLCTDGITRHLPDDELAELLSMDSSAQQICQELQRRCHQRGAEDNLTAVVLRFVDADEERTLPPIADRRERNDRRKNQPQIEVKFGNRNKSTASRSGNTGNIGNSVSSSGSRALFGTAGGMLIAVLVLAGAFYAGYLAQRYWPEHHNPKSPVTAAVDEKPENDRGSNNVVFQDALKLYDNREYSAARDRLNNLVNQNGASATPAEQALFYYWLGRSEYEIGDSNGALRDLQKAISLNFNTPSIYLYQALSYQAIGKDREASQSLHRFADERKHSPVQNNAPVDANVSPATH